VLCSKLLDNYLIDINLNINSSNEHADCLKIPKTKIKKMTSTFEFVPSERETPMLLLDKYAFQRVSKNDYQDGSTGWQCKERRNKLLTCRSKVTTIGNEIKKPATAHNHEPLTDVQIADMRQRCKNKQRCREEPHVSVSKIYSIGNKEFCEQITSGQPFDLDSNTAPDMQKFKSVKQGLYRQRWKISPPLPKSQDDINLSDEYKQTLCKQPFQIYDITTGTNERLIGMASQTALDILLQSDVWHTDGTFKTSPKFFYQTSTIHAWLFNEMHPCLFAYLPNKTQATYLTSFMQIREQRPFEQQKKPKTIMSDFEAAVINALQLAFPWAEVKGCLFHWGKAQYTNIVAKGLGTAYRTNYDVYHWCQLFKGLPHLPEHRVLDGVRYIYSVMPSEPPQLMDYFHYFVDTWINGDFPIKLWNHFNTTTPRTNNHLEGFNLKLLAESDSTNPSIFSSINHVKNIEFEVSKNYFCLSQGQSSKKRNSVDIARDLKISQLKHDFSRNLLTIPEFLFSMSSFYTYNSSVTPPEKIKLYSQVVNKPYDQVVAFMEKNRNPVINMVKKISFSYFSSFRYLIKNILLSKVKRIRSIETISFFTDQTIVNEFAINGVVVHTTGNGNCLYNAVSLSLIGNEKLSNNIKLCTFFMLLEYKAFFQHYCAKRGLSYEGLVESTAKEGEYAKDILHMAISLLCMRPFYSFTAYDGGLESNAGFSGKVPIAIFYDHRSAHYMAILTKLGYIFPRVSVFRFLFLLF
jgi:hypothetical protein